MLPSGSKDQSTAFQVVFYTLWTILISYTFIQIYWCSLFNSFSLSTYITFRNNVFYFAINLMLSKTDKSASLLIKSSIVYIAELQVVYAR